MNFLDAAYEILKAAKEPLHYQAIADRALQSGLITSDGKTPGATMGSRLYSDTQQEGSRFERVGRGLFSLSEQSASSVDAAIQAANNATHQQLLTNLRKIDPARFETLINELLIKIGFDESTVETTPYSRDGGIDVKGVFNAAGLTDVNVAVQVKRWTRTIGSKEVTQLRGSLDAKQQGIIITTSKFSAEAVREASASGKTTISLIDGDALVKLLVKHKVGVVTKSFVTITLDEEWWDEVFDAPVSTPDPLSKILPGQGRSIPPSVSDLASRPGVKPRAFLLDGRQYAVRSWKELLLSVCSLLARQHGEAFPGAVFQVRGRARPYFDRSTTELRSPGLIPETDVYVETNMSANQIANVLNRVLSVLGRDPKTLEIVSAD